MMQDQESLSSEQVRLSSYSEILAEIGRQLQARKGLLIKRTLLISWPFIVLAILVYVTQKVLDHGTTANVDASVAFQIFLWLLPVFPFLVLYVFITRFIFGIEKIIWIDSFFDGKNLDPKASWRIARRLFWPYLLFRLQIFVRFYLLPLFATVLIYFLGIYFFSDTTDGNTSYRGLALGILFITTAIFWAMYGYYVRIKLRYAPFVFLDQFGESTSGNSLFISIRELNKIYSSEAFKKALFSEFGADSAKAVAGAISSTFAGMLGTLGAGGRLTGTIIGAFGNELARNAADLGNITARYLMYRVARQMLYGKTQEVNEHLYRLGER